MVLYVGGRTPESKQEQALTRESATILAGDLPNFGALPGWKSGNQSFYTLSAHRMPPPGRHVPKRQQHKGTSANPRMRKGYWRSGNAARPPAARKHPAPEIQQVEVQGPGRPALPAHPPEQRLDPVKDAEQLLGRQRSLDDSHRIHIIGLYVACQRGRLVERRAAHHAQTERRHDPQCGFQRVRRPATNSRQVGAKRHQNFHPPRQRYVPSGGFFVFAS